jgi:hypothetical protein
MASILALRDQREKWQYFDLLFAENTRAVVYWMIRKTGQVLGPLSRWIPLRRLTRDEHLARLHAFLKTRLR